jgi:hypothetical protein
MRAIGTAPTTVRKLCTERTPDGRRGGWPHTFDAVLADFLIHPAKRENLPKGIVRRLR